MGTLADKIRATDDRPCNVVHIDEWDQDILLIAMTARERARFASAMKRFESGNIDDADLGAEMVVLSARDPETRELIFEPTAIGWLCDKSGYVVNKIAVEWLRLSGLTNASAEEAEKNSVKTRKGSPSLH